MKHNDGARHKDKGVKGKLKPTLGGLLVLVAIGAAIFLLKDITLPVLMPEGVVAEKERNLFIFTTFLGLLVVIPVFVMLFYVAWKYREANTKAKYNPEWDKSKIIEGIWWGIPCVIILLLGVITYYSSHELDPFKPLRSETKPVKVQVVALQWKWLFIYPEYNIASVNDVRFPVNTPVNFELTSDAPMNSFWIPSLGSQIYAMSGMSTKLHLQANEVGDYGGSSANISGEGFASMRFIARSTTQADFSKWVGDTKSMGEPLDIQEYDILREPSIEKTYRYFVLKKPDLYDTIVMKYMGAH